MTIALLLLIAVVWLAWNNGANDNFIGVATLYGSRTCTYRTALIWATLATGAGALVSVSFAHLLVARFSGAGLLNEQAVGAPLLAAVAGAAALTKWLATRLGMPASTTHALTGALVGAALVVDPFGIRWHELLGGFVLPLLLSLALAVAITVPFYWLLNKLRRRTGITPRTCVCIGNAAPQPVTVLGNGKLLLERADASLTLTIDEVDQCVERYAGRVFGIDAQSVIDATHYTSAAAVCFARAVSDTPKIAALLLAAGTAGATTFAGAGFDAPVTLGVLGSAFDTPLTLGLVGSAMLAGGWLHARRVAETMSRRITDLNAGQGLTANLVTAVLVLGASRLGLPVSTTQVSCSAIFGIGVVNGRRHWGTIAQIAATWLATLPFGLVLGAGIMWLLR